MGYPWGTHLGTQIGVPDRVPQMGLQMGTIWHPDWVSKMGVRWVTIAVRLTYCPRGEYGYWDPLWVPIPIGSR